MTSAARERAVREILAEITHSEDSLRETTDTSLDALGIDSAGMIELLFALEDRFSIEIGEDEVAPENFESISSLMALLARKCP